MTALQKRADEDSLQVFADELVAVAWAHVRMAEDRPTLAQVLETMLVYRGHVIEKVIPELHDDFDAKCISIAKERCEVKR